MFFICIMTAAQAPIYPSAVALALHTYKENTGYAMALFAFIQQILASSSALIAAYMPYNSLGSLGIIVLAIAIIGLSVFKLINFQPA